MIPGVKREPRKKINPNPEVLLQLLYRWKDEAAKAGKEDGFGLIGGSAIIAPTGEVAARALGEDDEVITATLDLELGDYIKRTIFNFEKHRRIEHYRLITERTGARTEV